jgi:DedD protein
VTGRKTERRRAGRGIVSLVAGALLLGLVGFGLGIGAGLVLEEPGLLIDYLTGRTTPAPLDAARSERDTANASHAEPAAAAVVANAAEPAASPRAAAGAHAAQTDAGATPPVAAAPPARVEPELEPPREEAAPVPRVPAPAGGGFAVQVGALADATSAEALAARLRKRGFAVYVAPSAEPGAQRWRVRVGPVATREEARELAARLDREKLPTWVLAEGPR